MVNEELLDIYGCPICKGRLNWNQEARKLYCHPCGKEYNITNADVPILVPDEKEYEKKYNLKYQ